MALYTGIRGCDIANLKLTDIDWKKERVSFVQEKTGNPIVLPLLPHVGNSLFDYIRNERDNEAGSVYLFPNKKNTIERLENKSIGTIVNTVFEKLNLRKVNPGVESAYFGTTSPLNYLVKVPRLGSSAIF